MNNIEISIIFRDDVKTSDIARIMEWGEEQSISLEMIFSNEVMGGVLCFPYQCLLKKKDELECEYIYRSVKKARGDYVTWIYSTDKFAGNALKEMHEIFLRNPMARLVCGNFSVNDVFGEKALDGYPVVAPDRVIQKIKTCFLVERTTLLQALKGCSLQSLWEQYVWNFIYRLGYTIEIIRKSLLKREREYDCLELKKGFAFLIRHYIETEQIKDVEYLLDSIYHKCGKDYLIERLLGCISSVVRDGWKKCNARDDKEKDRKERNARYLKKRNLVIQVEYGGLGDNLFFSHIPRIAKESGVYDKVFLSRKTKFRSKEICGLVWEPNPFLDGISDEAGVITELDSHAWDSIRQGRGNLLDYMMLAFGLDDGKRFHEPEIYYHPQKHRVLLGKTIYDPNYCSNAGDSVYPEMVDNYFHAHHVSVQFMLEPREKYIALHSLKSRYRTKSLFDFCDVLYSAQDIYCYATGTATLCAAMGKRAHVLYGENMVGWGENFFHSRLHDYIKL